MAGNLPVPAGVQVKLFFYVGAARTAINVLHFRNMTGAAIDLARATAIDTAISTAWTSSGHAASISTGVNFGGISVRDMKDNTLPEFTPTRNGIFGSAAGHLLPPQTALVVTLRTAKRGRSFQGRTYLWGFTEDVNDTGGVATAAAGTGAAAFLNAIRTGLTGAPSSLELCVLSRWTTVPGATQSTERNPPILEPVINAIALDARWDTQRRRAIPGT